MKKIDPFLMAVIIILIAVGALAVFFSYRSPSSKTQLTYYQTTDSEKPKIELSQTNFDFGEVSSSAVSQKEIEMKNTGQKDLEIGNITTSCDCTSAKVEIEGKESPKFSMHGNPSWIGQIKPGTSGRLIVIYEPQIMPVKGKIERVVHLQTNDPEKPMVEVTFQAEVK